MVVPFGPPPTAKATAKLVRHKRKINKNAPGTTDRNTGHSIRRKLAQGEAAKLCVTRNRSAGTLAQPCSKNRVASGKLKKTCARITPGAPYIESFARPAHVSIPLIQPARPKTASRPRTPTITGKINGAPSSVISVCRPIKLWRAKARAIGMAIPTLRPAEKHACHKVKRTADQSATLSTPSPCPRIATAAAVPIENISRAVKTAPPKILRKIIVIILPAIPPRQHCVDQQPPWARRSRIVQHSRLLETFQVGQQQG